LQQEFFNSKEIVLRKEKKTLAAWKKISKKKSFSWHQENTSVSGSRSRIWFSFISY